MGAHRNRTQWGLAEAGGWWSWGDVIKGTDLQVEDE